MATNMGSKPEGFGTSVADKAKGLAGQAGEAITGAKDRAQEWASTAGDKFGQAKDKVQDWASKTAEQVGEATNRVRDWASTASEKAGEAMKDVGDELTSFVRRYPIPSLLIGFGVGFILARALARRD